MNRWRLSNRPAWLLPSLQGYQPSWWRLDLLAGLAAGTVVIPQAMAYATIAGLPVEIGLYTCMAPMVLYALLGGARALSVSTTSTIAVLVATTLAGLSPRSSADLLGDAFTLTALVGVCLLSMRAFRLGSLVENISPATLTGVKVGVGLTVAAGQLPHLLGVSPDPDADGFFAKIADMLGKIPDAEPVTVAVSAAAFVVLLLLRRLVPKVPGPLLAVAGGIILVVATDVEKRGLDLIDPVPTGLPELSLPVFEDVFALLPGALAIAVMAFLETVLVARTNRKRTEPQISTDQELLATGVASLAGGLTQSLPPAGGFSQSAVNLRSGARSQLSGIVTALLAVATAMLLAPLLDDLPRSVLAAMVMVAILGLLDPRDFVRYARIDRAELWVAIVVTGLCLTGGMLLGVAAGVGLTLLLVVRELNHSRVRPLYRRAQGGWTINRPEGNEDGVAGVLLLHLDGPLYTGNARATVDAVVSAARDAVPPVHTVVVEGSAVVRVTVPMLDAVRSIKEELATEGFALTLAGFPPSTLEVMRRDPWFADAEIAGLVFATVDDALAAG
jgi:MFS superfamily sulfate permease-like transporter